MVLVAGYCTLPDIPPLYAFVDLDGKPETLLLRDHLLQPAGLLSRLLRPETLLLHCRVHLPPAGLLGLLLRPETIPLHDHLRLASLLLGLLLWVRLRTSAAVTTKLVLAEMVSADVPSLFFQQN